MATEPLLAGVDVGTTHVKAAVYDPEGRSVASATAPTPTRRPAPGRTEHDAEELWGAVVTVLREAVGTLEEPTRIVSVAVASVAEAGVPLDARGAPTSAIIAWHDRRSDEQARRLAGAVGAVRLRSLTGLPPAPIYGVHKLAWLMEHAPDAVARARTWLNVADYVAYRLCGQPATDFSLGTRTGALDLVGRRWSDEVLDAAGVPASLLPPLVASGTALGRLTAEAAAATGLPVHAAVGAGGHDHVCGALAAGVVDPGRALDSIGTAESLLVPLDAPLDPGADAPRYSQGVHVAADRWYVSRGIHAGGASLDWALRTLGAGASAAALLEDAAAVPAGAGGVVFAPAVTLAGVADEPAGLLAGLRPATGAAEVLRAVHEGLAVAARDVLDTLVEQARPPAEPQVRVIGGGAGNRLLLAVKAAVAGRPLHRPAITESSTLGAALLGGVAAGVLPDASAGAAGVRCTVEEIAADPGDIAAYADVTRRVRALRGLER